jgi:cytochrome c heme-lyase
MADTPKESPTDHTKISTAAPPTKTEEVKCPVDHSKMAQQPQSPEEPKCPVDHTSHKKILLPRSENSSSEPQSCPVDPSTYKNFLPPAATTAAKEGCDSTTIDSSNNMPNIPQQAPQPDQKISLGKDRETSTIPRANSDDKLWIYPSEQMFFNAMRRKNWSPEEQDMSVVVPIHNAVNEMAWQKILEWEKLHQT